MDKILLSHGSGQGQNELLQKIIFPILFPKGEAPFEDAAVLEADRLKTAFTTDSFVIHPLVFPGGDIGKLAACGTINDLCMMGARPRAISLSLILEEGLELGLLRQVLESFAQICHENGVRVACGDSKVVEKGKADGLYINTSGIGAIDPQYSISASNTRPGDTVLVSGPIGLHGIAVLAARKGLNFATEAVSDCASLQEPVFGLLEAVPQIRAMRDCTRGGCASVLNEIATASGVSINIEENAVPMPAVVQGACSYLGMDPLHIPCEGRFIAIAPSGRGETALKALIQHGDARDAAIIGRVTPKGRYPVTMTTSLGGSRLVEYAPGELLPRIC